MRVKTLFTLNDQREYCDVCAPPLLAVKDAHMMDAADFNRFCVGMFAGKQSCCVDGKRPSLPGPPLSQSARSSRCRQATPVIRLQPQHGRVTLRLHRTAGSGDDRQNSDTSTLPGCSKLNLMFQKTWWAPACRMCVHRPVWTWTFRRVRPVRAWRRVAPRFSLPRWRSSSWYLKIFHRTVVVLQNLYQQKKIFLHWFTLIYTKTLKSAHVCSNVLDDFEGRLAFKLFVAQLGSLWNTFL